MLGEIDVVTKSLQNKADTISKCRTDLSVLMASVEKDRTNPKATRFDCTMSFGHISSLSLFEEGAVKSRKRKSMS